MKFLPQRTQRAQREGRRKKEEGELPITNSLRFAWPITNSQFPIPNCQQ
ncbi:MAG: hypothetical protein HC942_30680 [Microcoleus sp. SU_5_6]|nr:hypothetical protein [Microcoleus sp. SU_5_6]NJL67529.1 hypothetical protein [Microcoleus sp. SM1_3_4]